MESHFLWQGDTWPLAVIASGYVMVGVAVWIGRIRFPPE